MGHETAFRGRVITPDGDARTCVLVAGGRIAAVEPIDAEVTAERVIELRDDEVLLPGLVDTHVHVNDPGRADWEGFETATLAAAAGGVTTLVDMPLNSVPPTVEMSALSVKRHAARGRLHVDVGFWGGMVPENSGELDALHEAGVFGFKCFLLPSGVPEFPPLRLDELADRLRHLAKLDALAVVHAEHAGVIEHAGKAGGRRYADFLASRPRGAENLAIAQLIEVARRTKARVHVLHLSSSDALPMIASARRDGVAITAETCPHYLTLSAEEIADGATEFKCCPPIREGANRDPLWRGLADGTLDCVVSDHSPCPADLKRGGDFGEAWGGISGLQLGLPAVWTEARRRDIPLADVARWLASAPADLVGMRRKGRIEVGRDADFCVFAPDETFTVDAGRLRHRHPISAYHGRRLSGVVRGAWVRGREVTGEDPHGVLLSRGRA